MLWPRDWHTEPKKISFITCLRSVLNFLSIKFSVQFDSDLKLNITLFDPLPILCFVKLIVNNLFFSLPGTMLPSYFALEMDKMLYLRSTSKTWQGEHSHLGCGTDCYPLATPLHGDITMQPFICMSACPWQYIGHVRTWPWSINGLVRWCHHSYRSDIS